MTKHVTVELPDAFPLVWPDGWPRAKAREHNNRYAVTDAQARADLVDELHKLHARDFVLSSNLPVRKDGMPYLDANRRNVTDPGVAVYWVDRKNRPWVIACDKWSRVPHNMRAIYYAISGIRQIQRSGASELLERAYKGFRALPAEAAGSGWWRQVLGFQAHEPLTREKIEAKYRALAVIRHPDRGGTQDEMVLLNRARESALQEIADG